MCEDWLTLKHMDSSPDSSADGSRLERVAVVGGGPGGLFLAAQLKKRMPSVDVVLFEANATMVIAPVDPDERWAYRRTAISTIIDAVVAMLEHKSTQAGRA